MMLLLWSTAVLAVALICPVAATGKSSKTSSRLEKYIPNLCKRSDPQLNYCVKEIVTKDLIKFAKTGIPEINMPAFEPIVIQEFDLKPFQGISFSFFGRNIFKSNKHNAFVRNLQVHHSSEFIINDLKIDNRKNELYIDFSFPYLQVEGEYDFNLMMFNMPIKSKGSLSLNLTDYSLKATLYGKTLKRNAVTLLVFDTIDIKLDHSDYFLVIDKVFNKDSVLNEILNNMLKNQKNQLKKLAMPMNEEILGKLILKMSNRILSCLPVEELLSPE